MRTKFIHCQVPWAISPTGSGLTSIHEQTDAAPKCRVVFGAGRLNNNGLTDFRRIELEFELAYFTRTTPHDDRQSPVDYGFDIVDGFQGDMKLYLDWRERCWMTTSTCPDSGFYIAQSSDWLNSVPDFFRLNCRHYLIHGRDGHIELLAAEYRWTEWMVDEKSNRAWSDAWPKDTAVYQSS